MPVGYVLYFCSVPRTSFGADVDRVSEGERQNNIVILPIGNAEMVRMISETAQYPG